MNNLPYFNVQDNTLRFFTISTTLIFATIWVIEQKLHFTHQTRKSRILNSDHSRMIWKEITKITLSYRSTVYAKISNKMNHQKAKTKHEKNSFENVHSVQHTTHNVPTKRLSHYWMKVRVYVKPQISHPTPENYF